LFALGAVLTAWWGISVCNQFRSGAWTARIRRHLPLGLIPLWTFFAPNPARSDTRLIWREERAGQWDDWQELHFGFAAARSRWLINPELILNKAVTDLATSIPRNRGEDGDRSYLLSSSYVTLLRIVLDQIRENTCSSIQFAIVRTSWGSEARQIDLIHVSEVHQVTDNSADV